MRTLKTAAPAINNQQTNKLIALTMYSSVDVKHFFCSFMIIFTLVSRTSENKKKWKKIYSNFILARVNYREKCSHVCRHNFDLKEEQKCLLVDGSVVGKTNSERISVKIWRMSIFLMKTVTKWVIRTREHRDECRLFYDRMVVLKNLQAGQVFIYLNKTQRKSQHKPDIHTHNYKHLLSSNNDDK